MDGGSMIDLKGIGLIAGDIIHLDPDALPDLKIITKEEADRVAEIYPKRQFIITANKKI